MTIRRRGAIIAGLVVVGVEALVPPWIDQTTVFRYHLGHLFLFAPPAVGTIYVPGLVGTIVGLLLATAVVAALLPNAKSA